MKYRLAESTIKKYNARQSNSYATKRDQISLNEHLIENLTYNQIIVLTALMKNSLGFNKKLGLLWETVKHYQNILNEEEFKNAFESLNPVFFERVVQEIDDVEVSFNEWVWSFKDTLDNLQSLFKNKPCN